MRGNIKLQASTLLTVLVLTGCNIFNPGGEGESGTTGLTAQGDIYLQNGQFAKAMATYTKAIAQDSASSQAYYGYAIATSNFYQLRNVAILNDVISTSGDNQFAFLEHSDSILTLRLQAASRVQRILGILTDRDTLTQWYNYLTDSTSAAALSDTLYAERRAFMEGYIIEADLRTPGYRSESSFPLTDFRRSYKNVLPEFAIFKMLYTITKLYDFDGNDTVDTRDALMKKLQFGKGDGFSIDSLGSIADDLENDTTGANAANLNALVAGMQSGLTESSSLLGLIVPEGDSGSASQQSTGDGDAIIASLGDAILFYQFGDGLDNDGDGCIDEEIMDDKDNDGDGFVDEDARVIKNPQLEARDNDRNGIGSFNGIPPFVSDPGEDTVGAAVNAQFPWRLRFVQNHLDTAVGADTAWVKIRKGHPDMDVRLRIQKDSLATKTKAQLEGPLKQKLDSAKALMGGCWRNYPTHSP